MHQKYEKELDQLFLQTPEIKKLVIGIQALCITKSYNKKTHKEIFFKKVRQVIWSNKIQLPSEQLCSIKLHTTINQQLTRVTKNYRRAKISAHSAISNHD